MLEAILSKNNYNLKLKITVKTLVSALIIACAVVFPLITHAVLGADGGAKLLPMYLPVLVGGCLLGVKWGLAVGLLSPVISFLITFALGNAMPAAVRLPYMMAELAVYAAVTGAFSSKISKNTWIAFPAVLFAAVAGRCVFLAVAAIFQSVSPLTPYVVWQQIQTGLSAVILQAVIAPLTVIGIFYIFNRKD